MQTTLLKRAKRIRRFSDTTSFGEKMYLLGLFLLLWSAPIWMFSKQTSAVIMISGLLVFTGGLVSEAINLIHKIWNNTYGKVFLSLLAAVASTVTIAVSAFIVADITGSDPSKFPYTTTIVSFLLIPINTWLLLVGFATLSTVFFVATVPVFFAYNQTVSSPVFRYAFRIEKKPRKERYFWLMMLVRFLAIGFLFGTITFSGRFDKAYTHFILDNASSFIYNFEMYPKSHCDQSHPNARFAYINAKLVLIGKRILLMNTLSRLENAS
ncbi:hypothetical protein [Vibrio parahaemolyticus]|uniref:hypothetical protein n=1 Tax=Vibrio parahaemolyticus TaxID=670 RepID=UPI002361F969|nr:hypothetical protein [Vibrio parahaemolyticus]